MKNYFATKIYGLEGHRQAESFCKSWAIEGNRLWNNPNNEVEFFGCLCSDYTHTNEFVVFFAKCNSIDAYERLLDGQLSEGTFENQRVGKMQDVQYPHISCAKLIKEVKNA